MKEGGNEMPKLELTEITIYPDPKGTIAAAAEMTELWKRATRDLRIPVLASEKMPVGGTGYLDCLQGKGMSAPVMVGTDREGRAFIAYHLILEDGDSRSGVVTAFQRYTDSEKLWTSGGSLSNHIVFGYGDAPAVQCFKDLLEGGRHEIEIENYHLGEPTGVKRKVVVRLDA